MTFSAANKVKTAVRIHVCKGNNVLNANDFITAAATGSIRSVSLFHGRFEGSTPEQGPSVTGRKKKPVVPRIPGVLWDI